MTVTSCAGKRCMFLLLYYPSDDWLVREKKISKNDPNTPWLESPVYICSKKKDVTFIYPPNKQPEIRITGPSYNV